MSAMNFDLIIRNVHLPEGLRDIAVWAGRIVAITPPGEMSLAVGEYDAGGAWAFPGFNDVHSHSVWFGETLMEIDVSGATRCADVYDAISTGMSNEHWVIASGFLPSALSDGPLNIDILDQISDGHPLLIKHNSGHAITVNTQALELAGIGAYPTTEIPGGTINTDANGKATGVLDENAMRPINELLEPKSEAHLVEALTRASQVYASQGLTSITDAGIAGGWIGHSPLELAAYQRAREEEALLHRTQVMITFDVLHPVDHHADDPAAFTMDAGLRTGLGDDRLQIGPAKIFTDGSFSSETAALHEDYCHCAGNSGYFQRDPELMQAEALQAAAGGWSLAMHALGDAAIDLALDTITKANATFGRPRIPHRIEHGGICSNDQLQRMADEGIALATQPRFLPTFGDHQARILGKDRYRIAYPAARVLNAGGILPGSSDRPVANGHPLKVMESFVQRLSATGQCYSPDDRLTIAQAIDAYTVGSAAATGWAGVKGRIEPGYLADIVLLDRNLLDQAPDEIANADVLATIRGGEFIFKK